MSADFPDALADAAAATGVCVRAEGLPLVEAALTVLLVTVAVLLISFISVATNL
jgi:hypothetical protein